jgi:hypothetical protein
VGGEFEGFTYFYLGNALFMQRRYSDALERYAAAKEKGGPDKLLIEKNEILCEENMPRRDSASAFQAQLGTGSAISELEQRFGVRIIVENQALLDCVVRFGYDGDSLHGLLSVLARALNAELIKEGNTYIIRGGRCG